MCRYRMEEEKETWLSPASRTSGADPASTAERKIKNLLPQSKHSGGCGVWSDGHNFNLGPVVKIQTESLPGVEAGASG